MLRIGLFVLTNLAVMFVFGLILSITGVDRQSTLGLIIMAGLFGFTGSIISLLMSKTIALKSVGGNVITHPKNQTEAWLLETVRKQASQAGIGMPTVAIYQAADMNAFATGANRNDALVAVSTGLLTQMQQNEVEAVLAHEVSHIANGDMITMTLLQGIVNTFVIFISRMIANIVSSMGSNNENGRVASMGTYFILVMVLEVVFGMLASLITFWFSRRREYHADAGAAQLVGKQNMIAALERLKSSRETTVDKNITVLAININKQAISELFMTHPPLDKRIEALKRGAI